MADESPPPTDAAKGQEEARKQEVRRQELKKKEEELNRKEDVLRRRDEEYKKRVEEEKMKIDDADKAIEAGVMSAAPYGQDIGEEESRQADMDVDFQEDKVKAWRGMEKKSGSAWGMEGQLIEALKKIDVLNDEIEYLLNKNEFKDKLLKAEKGKTEELKKVVINQTIIITDNRSMIKNMLEDNDKLKSDEKLASQPELIELKRTKKDLEDVKKALEESKKAEETVAILAETYKMHVDIVNKHLNNSSELNRMEKKSDCAFWLESRCKFSDKKCKSLHHPSKKGIKEKSVKEPEQQQVNHERLVNKLDCAFWMENRCRYTDKKCRGSHDPIKRGSRERKQDEANQQDFHQSLAQVAAQIPAMEAYTSAHQVVQKSHPPRGLKELDLEPQSLAQLAAQTPAMETQTSAHQVVQKSHPARGLEELVLEPQPAKGLEVQEWRTDSKKRGFKRGGRRLVQNQTPSQRMEEQSIE